LFYTKYLTAKIAYFKFQYNKFPHGNPGKASNRDVIYVTYTPQEGHLDINHRKRFIIDKNPDLYKLIKNGEKYKNAIDTTQLQLKKTSDYEHIEMHMPIISSSRFNTRYFMEAAEYQNNFEYKNKYEYNGKVFRSKNEVTAAQLLDSMGIPYKVETSYTDYQGNTYYPDFLLLFEAVDRCVYWEIMGKCDDYQYLNRATGRIVAWIDDGLVCGVDFIFSMCKSDAIFDIKAAKALIAATAETITETETESLREK